MNLQDSVTLKNLMRAFAGESQARNRYDFAAGAAAKEGLYLVRDIFEYTAGQEREHAELFFKRMKLAGVENVEISGGYPVDIQSDVLSLIKNAKHNEEEEWQIVYPDFARAARQEGFEDLGFLFDGVAQIERTHAQRFALLAGQIESGQIFRDVPQTAWVCLNCGNVFIGAEPPIKCPICAHDRGYYIRESAAPYVMRG